MQLVVQTLSIFSTICLNVSGNVLFERIGPKIQSSAWDSNPGTLKWNSTRSLPTVESVDHSVAGRRYLATVGEPGRGDREDAGCPFGHCAVSCQRAEGGVGRGRGSRTSRMSATTGRRPHSYLTWGTHQWRAGRQSRTHAHTRARATPYRNLFRSGYRSLPRWFTPASDCPVVQVTDYIGYVCLGFVGIKDRFPSLRTLRLVLDGPFKLYSSILRGCSILNIDFIHSGNKILFITYLVITMMSVIIFEYPIILLSHA